MHREPVNGLPRWFVLATFRLGFANVRNQVTRRELDARQARLVRELEASRPASAASGVADAPALPSSS